MRTGKNHPLGEGYPVVTLESDHRGASQLVYDGKWHEVNILEGKVISQETLLPLQAARIAREYSKMLPKIQ